MKRTAQFILFTAFFVADLSAQTRRIAVYDFDQTAVNSDVTRIYGSQNPVGGTLSASLISKLLASGQFEVIDRSHIDEIMKQQNLKFSDRFDPSEAPKLGKLLNVDAIVTGKISLLTGKIEGSIYKVPLGGASIDRRVIHATVTANVSTISTESARILMAEAVTKDEKKPFSQAIAIRGAQTANGSDLSGHPEAEVVNLALQETAEQLASLLAAKAGQMPVRISTEAPPPSTKPSGVAVSVLKVGRVDGDKVYVGAGESAGIKEGETYDIRRVTGSFKNDQGVDVETDETIEQVVIKDVQDQFAVGKPVHSGPSLAKAGDRVRKSKTPAAGK